MAGMVPSSALAGEVHEISLSSGAAGTQAEIRLQGAGSFNTLSLSNPDRLVVDLPESTLQKGIVLPGVAGVVHSVRTGQPVPGTVRIVFDLSGPVAALPPRVENIGNISRLVIVWPEDRLGTSISASSAAVSSGPSASTVPAEPSTDASSTSNPGSASLVIVQETPTLSPMDILTGKETAAPASRVDSEAAVAALTGDGSIPASTVPAPVTVVPPAAASTPDTASSPPAQRSAGITMQPGMRPLIVAIDAGHGGQDPGAVGPTGRREKDVTLAVARELARQVDATPGLKAFLVRSSDVFIPLTERTQRARRAKADIFVSIHADAAENRSATGSSVYVLSLRGASSQRARWLADKENAADLIGGVRLGQTENTLASVLLDLAQSGHMKASEDAANHVLGGLKRVGNNHKPNIERANFVVLRTADMPAMLVETAFISNHAEEQRLVDPAFQRRLAGAVLDGITTYFTRQPPPGTLFAARAQAERENVAVVADASSSH